MNTTTITKENARAEAFAAIWSNDIDPVFTDVAKYYDCANDFASLGLISIMRRRFVSMIDVRPNYKWVFSRICGLIPALVAGPEYETRRF